MVHDLEEVLGIEAARSGEATGEATTILRSLPGDTADFAPERLRRPRRTLVLGVAAIALVAGAIAFGVTRTEKGAGGSVTPGSGRLSEVRLGQGAASDYDPEGDDGEEYPSAARLAIDGIRPTNWETETYQGGQWPGGKSGVGLYVDADRAIRARRLDLVSSTPGLQGGDLRVGQRRAPLHRRLDPAHRAGHRGRGEELHPRPRRAPLPLLPGVDHGAAGVRQGPDPGTGIKTLT